MQTIETALRELVARRAILPKTAISVSDNPRLLDDETFGRPTGRRPN